MSAVAVDSPNVPWWVPAWVAVTTGLAGAWSALGALAALQRGAPAALVGVAAATFAAALLLARSGSRAIGRCLPPVAFAAAIGALWSWWALRAQVGVPVALHAFAAGALLGGAARCAAAAAARRGLAALLAGGAAAAACWAWPRLAAALGDDAAPLLAAATLALGVAALAGTGAAAASRWWSGGCALAVMGAGGWLVAQVGLTGAPIWLALALAFASAWAFAAVLPRVGFLLGAGFAVAAAVAWLPPLGNDLRVLERRGAVAVGYDRATQLLTLRRDDQVVGAVGPDCRQDELTATLALLGRSAGDRALVFGAGALRTAALLAEVGALDVELVVAAADSPVLACRLLADGPVAVPDAGLPPAVHWRPCRPLAWLGALPAGARQVVVVGESPTERLDGAAMGLSGWPQADANTQAELRRVAGDGPVLQVFRWSRLPLPRLRQLCAAAAACSPWTAVFAVGDCGVLYSATARPAWWDDATPWPTAVRWLGHRAHLGGLADLHRACHGLVAAGGEPGTVVALPAGDDELVTSVLAGWQRRGERLAAAAAELPRLADDPAGRERAQQLAAELLPLGAPSAPLQAALGLAGGEIGAIVAPAAAALRAHALDPTFWGSAPPVFATLPRPRQPTGDLEDLSMLPAAPRLAELCVGSSPQAIALRARFPSRCAEALVARLAVAPLDGPAAEALRELADPFVLGEAGRVLRGRGAVGELLAFWRRDLPLPAALGDLIGQGDAARARLATALAGHRDRASLQTLADLLAADAVTVRVAAGVALRVTAGDTIPYDPAWPRSARETAADQLRALHNRLP